MGYLLIQLMKLKLVLIFVILIVAFSSTNIAKPNSGNTLRGNESELKKIELNVKQSFVAQIAVYPNPTSKKITISSEGIAKDLKVNIYNSVGKLVRLARMNSVDKPYDVQVTDLANGIYFVKLIDGEKVVETKKLIVAK